MGKQRLIDANTLVGADGLFATRGCTGNCSNCNLWSTEGCRVILEAPTVEAATVVHGQWTSADGYRGVYPPKIYKCSICRDYYTDEPKSLYYCPRCGAKMEVEAAYEKDHDFRRLCPL